MKHMKKALSLLLALVMVLGLSSTAWADDTDGGGAGSTTTGTVTINGALKGNTFTLYKIFDLETFSGSNFSYTISTSSPLYDTVNTMMLGSNKVFTLTAKDANTFYVTLSDSFKSITDDSTEIKTIASSLMAKIDALSTDGENSFLAEQIKYVGIETQEKLPADKADYISATVTADANKYNIKFSQLDLGYYLVDSSAGTMIGLTTTKPTASITAKNQLPTVEKKVKANSDGSWQDENSRAVGEEVSYRVAVSVEQGAKNYVIYDTLSQGLTFKKITKVYYGYINPNGKYLIYDSNTPGMDTLSGNTNFTYVSNSVTHKNPETGVVENCCFSMKFSDSLLNDVWTDSNNGGNTGYSPTIYVEYTAVLNKDAVIGDTGNPNDVYLTYGDNDVDVAKDRVSTYAYKVELVKTTSDGTALDGAEFELYHTRNINGDGTETLSDQLYFVKSESDGKTVYRVATPEEKDVTGKTTTTIEAGDVIISGLGGNFSSNNTPRTYYLKETKAPQGYNKVRSAIEINVTDHDNLVEYNETEGKNIGGVQVVNKTGSELPSTGGMGTTIFYIIGGILVAAAVVLLVTKKRMNNADK